MRLHSVLPYLVIVAVVSIACAVGGATGSIKVKVNDTRGKPAAGTKVWLERLDTKAPVSEAVTTTTGELVFRNVPPGTYKISAYDRRIPAAAATLAKSAGGSETAVTLSLDKMVRAVETPKKAKHYVYVAGETGTHIGGGHWVAVEDDVGGSGANPVDKRGGQTLNQPQSFQYRPYQPPGQ